MKEACQFCGREIDSAICHCGIPISQHTQWDGHSPVPMGCDCGRVTEEEIWLDVESDDDDLSLDVRG